MSRNRTSPTVDSAVPGASDDEPRQRVLIVVTSRHGGTLEIAGSLAQEIVGSGMSVVVAEADDDTDVASFDAVLVGSAVYMGRWMKPARKFIERRAAELADCNVWLFSSGPLGDDQQSGMDPDHVRWLLQRSGAVEHREFGGRLDTSSLRPLESLVTHSVHAPSGDFRDWTEIRGWAREIAEVIART